MIQVTASTRLLIAIAPQDFRKGIDGFAYLCRKAFQQDPKNGSLFVFINRSKTMVRILVYEHNGYWLMTKRLSKGKYRDWPKSDQAVTSLMARELRQLLRNEGARLVSQAGVKIVKESA